MKYLLGIALGLLLLLAPIAKADGFNPADVTVGELVFGPFTIQEEVPQPLSPGATYEVVVEQVSPQGAEFWGFCITALAPGPSPLCPMGDGPQTAFEPAGAFFDVATAVFGFDPGINPPCAHNSCVTTPEPSTGGLLLVAGCFLCAFVALRRRMA
jgi:hypothetical protein